MFDLAGAQGPGVGITWAISDFHSVIRAPVGTGQASPRGLVGTVWAERLPYGVCRGVTKVITPKHPLCADAVPGPGIRL